MGPVLTSAQKYPSDLKTYTVGTETRVNPDTLVVTISEPLALANDYKMLLRFRGSANCSDPSSIQGAVDTVFSLGTATEMTKDEIKQLNGDTTLMTFKVIVDNTRRTPQIGDCIYLMQTGPFTDVNGNTPGYAGVPLNGGQSVQLIRGVAGYPPVSGLDPNSPAFRSANAAPINNVNNGVTATRTGIDPVTGNFQWIPPVNFPTNYSGAPYTPMATHSMADSANIPSTETKSYGGTFPAIPNGISTVQIIASSRYIAHVHLTDHMGRFVKSWTQDFGFSGEFSNDDRAAYGGKLSYLVWDKRDSKGQLAGQGVYVWNVIFETTKGKETFVTRTGLVR